MSTSDSSSLTETTSLKTDSQYARQEEEQLHTFRKFATPKF